MIVIPFLPVMLRKVLTGGNTNLFLTGIPKPQGRLGQLKHLGSLAQTGWCPIYLNLVSRLVIRETAQLVSLLPQPSKEAPSGTGLD